MNIKGLHLMHNQNVVRALNPLFSIVGELKICRNGTPNSFVKQISTL